MAGGEELEQLSHELEGEGGAAADVGHLLEEDVSELGIGGSRREPGSDAAVSHD